MTPRQKYRAAAKISKCPTITVDTLREFFLRNDGFAPTRKELITFMEERQGWAWRRVMDGLAAAWEKLV